MVSGRFWMSCKLQPLVRDYLALTFFVFAYERFDYGFFFFVLFYREKFEKNILDYIKTANCGCK